MSDLLESYGKAWREQQPAPTPFDARSLRQPMRYPALVLAVAGLVAASVVVLLVSGVFGSTSRLSGHSVEPGGGGAAAHPTVSPVTVASPAAGRHAGTDADPVPWVAQPVVPEDVPAPGTAGGMPVSAPTCSSTSGLSATLAFHRDGGGFDGVLTIGASLYCQLPQDVTVRLPGAQGAATGVSLGGPKTSPGLAPPAYAPQPLGTGLAPVAATVTMSASCPAVGPAADLLVNGRRVGTARVTGLADVRPCRTAASTPMVLGPFGKQLPPPLAPSSRAAVLVTVSVLRAESPTTLRPLTATLLLRLSDPTSQAIPLRPCPGVNLALDPGFASALGPTPTTFGLNCAQAPPAIPAHGSLVFQVDVRAAATAPAAATVSAMVSASIAGAAPGTATDLVVTTAPPGTPSECAAADLVVGTPTGGTYATRVALSASRTCQLPSAALFVPTPDLRRQTSPQTLGPDRYVEVAVVDAVDHDGATGCQRLPGPDTGETVTVLGRTVLRARVIPDACGNYLEVTGLPACTAGSLRVTAVTYDEILAGDNAYNVALTPAADCLLMADDVRATGVPPAAGDGMPNSVIASPDHPAYIVVSGPTGGPCEQSLRHTTTLGLSIDGTPVAPPTAPGQSQYTLCATGNTVEISDHREEAASH